MLRIQITSSEDVRKALDGELAFRGQAISTDNRRRLISELLTKALVRYPAIAGQLLSGTGGCSTGTSTVPDGRPRTEIDVSEFF